METLLGLIILILDIVAIVSVVMGLRRRRGKYCGAC